MSNNTLRVWALIDANRSPLFSSNIREQVADEFERRVADDPRLRRVLSIVEQTVTFHPRDEPEPDPGERQTVCVLPWLPLDEAIRMGSLVFDHWSQVREQVPEPARSTADQLLGSLTGVHGDPIDPVICSFWDRIPTAHLDEEGMEFMRVNTFLLALAGLAENVYMHQAFEPMTAAHARRFFLNFQAARPHTRVIRRRREGWAQSQWRSSTLRLTKPVAAETRPTAAGTPFGMTLYRQQFVDVLSQCVGTDDALSRAIRQSVVPYLRANDMDEYGAVEQDIIWLVTALEQLLAIAQSTRSGRRGGELHVRIAELFSDEWPVTERRVCRRWLQDLVRKRNELHGHELSAAGWQSWAHALLATELYPLAVKALLAGADRYIPDGFDRMKIGAFPSRVALIQGHGPFEEMSLGEAWHQIAVDTTQQRLARNQAEDEMEPPNADH